MSDFDIAIVGAGIAGASVAAEIGDAKSVLLLEAEQLPGYHSTGRSAAFWVETYGGPAIQPLTRASGPFLANPPNAFAAQSFLRRRGTLHLGQSCDREIADNMRAEFAQSGLALKPLNPENVAWHIRGLRDGWCLALWEPDCYDIDVAALHAAYLKMAKMSGAQLLCNAPLKAAQFRECQWTLDTGGGSFTARTLVNASGAWADPVARMAGISPLGITPYRRTIMQLAISPSAATDLPLVVGLDGSFYFKPEAGGKLWLSPHDEIPSEPCDAAPEEIDIAQAIDRFQQVVDWEIRGLERKWAGLRSFSPDRLPVIGSDPDIPEFFWLAGQGGFGIQTAPAVAQIAAAMLLDKANPLADINPANYLPSRLR